MPEDNNPKNRNDYVKATTISAKEEVKPATLNMGKVFLWFAIGLVITGVISFAMPDVLIFMAKSFSWSDDTLSNVYLILIIVSAILMIPSNILMCIKSFKPKSIWMSIGYVIYTICMGVLLSSVLLTVYVESIYTDVSFLQTMAIAFFATGGCFGLMFLIGFFTKKNLGILIPFIFTLIIGATVISLVNYFVGSSIVYWVVDFIMFGAILIITAIDINHAKQIAESGGFTSDNNLAIYCAYMFYVDFINIFIRIVFYILANSRRK